MLLLLATAPFSQGWKCFFLRIWHKGPVGETCDNSTASLGMLRAQLSRKDLGWTICRHDLVDVLHHILFPTSVAQVCRGIKKKVH